MRAIFDKILKSLPDNVTQESVFSPSQTTFIPDAPVSIAPEAFEKFFTAFDTSWYFTGRWAFTIPGARPIFLNLFWTRKSGYMPWNGFTTTPRPLNSARTVPYI
jgi:hypothetical protein